MVDDDQRHAVLLMLLGILLAWVLVGCAARSAPVVPTIVNLSPALANEKARWWIDSGGCHLVITKADGTAMYPPVSDADCSWAATWAKAQAAVPKPAQTPEKGTP